MEKNLYSLILSDSVVAQIDRIAARRGTNRSSLVNTILAEYASMTTPEMKIDSIFRLMEEMMTSTGDIVPFFTPNRRTISLKSTLEYKYRPTIKYDVHLFRSADSCIGELSIAFRTQSGVLLDAIESFFRLWSQLENTYVGRLTGREIRYTVCEGRIIRELYLPQNEDYTNDVLAQKITDYIRTTDELLKSYLNKKYSREDIEQIYISAVRDGRCII